MEALQDVLGQHQGSVAAQALLLELGATAHLSKENGFTYGLLYAQERARADDTRRAFEPAMRNASTTSSRRWTP